MSTNPQLLKAIEDHEHQIVNPDNVHFVDHLYRVDGTFGLVALVLEDCAQDALDTIVDETDLLNAYEVSPQQEEQWTNESVSYLGNYGKAHLIDELQITRLV